MMSEPVKRKLSMPEIVEKLRSKHRLSPEVQQLVAQHRRRFEGERDAFHAVARGIIDDAQKRLATALSLDPKAFAQVPDDVLDQLLASNQIMKALEEVPGAKMHVSFTSEVTVNGVRVSDEGEL